MKKNFKFHGIITKSVKKEDGKKFIEGLASVTHSSRDEDIIPPEAFDLETYKTNPIVWYQHRPWKDDNGNDVPIGKAIDVFVVKLMTNKDNPDVWDVTKTEDGEVITTLEKTRTPNIKIEGEGGLWCKIEITVDAIWDMIEKGVLSAFSWQGYVEWDDRLADEGVWVAIKIDLLELSVVMIQANEGATFNIAKGLIFGTDSKTDKNGKEIETGEVIENNSNVEESIMDVEKELENIGKFETLYEKLKGVFGKKEEEVNAEVPAEATPAVETEDVPVVEEKPADAVVETPAVDGEVPVAPVVEETPAEDVVEEPATEETPAVEEKPEEKLSADDVALMRTFLDVLKSKMETDPEEKPEGEAPAEDAPVVEDKPADETADVPEVEEGAPVAPVAEEKNFNDRTQDSLNAQTKQMYNLFDSALSVKEDDTAEKTAKAMKEIQKKADEETKEVKALLKGKANSDQVAVLLDHIMKMKKEIDILSHATPSMAVEEKADAVSPIVATCVDAMML